jgi:hypothetical protein
MMVDGECKAAARMAAREGHGCVKDGGIRIARQAHAQQRSAPQREARSGLGND